MIINKDPTNAHEVRIAFEKDGKETAARLGGTVNVATFGAAEYAWHPSGAASFADPDGPPKRSAVDWTNGQTALLPKASITVLTGKMAGGG
jgi:hypothetical protein